MFDERGRDEMKTKKKARKKLSALLSVILILAFSILTAGCSELDLGTVEESFDLDSIPEYSGKAYVVLNDNVPDFNASDLSTESYENYGRLDYLGRCTVASANIGQDLMPTEERTSISHIKPTGWQFAKYDFVDGKYLYNRCHLIAFQLTGENDNEQNLITGTRYMNVEMIEFEEMVGDYVRETGNHVRYRVTPIFEGTNPLASGIQMEAMSVEDNGEAIMFNVYFYNVQPGVEIDYETGNNWLAEESSGSGNGSSSSSTSNASDSSSSATKTTYILNTSSGKFHIPGCSGVKQMSDANKVEFNGTRDEVINAGYEACGTCKP